MINYLIGDATEPVGDGLKIIPHICNDIGAWGAGFVLALSNKWPEPETFYRKWHRAGHMSDVVGRREHFKLGAVQCVSINTEIIVANMIGQRGIYSRDNIPPIRYDALNTALDTVFGVAALLSASIHAPRFGAGLAGGDWSVIEKILHEKITHYGVKVTIYDLLQNTIR